MYPDRMPPITEYSQITGEWLTWTLTRNRALIGGRVQSIEVEKDLSNWSNIARIAIEYTPSSKGPKPERLFLKMVQTEEFGRSEVDYYSTDYIALPDAPIPRCYDADYAENPRRYHILMDDHSETHTGNYDRPPTLEYGLALADACAAMHSHWWGSDRLTASGHSLPNEWTIGKIDAAVSPGYTKMLDAIREDMGDQQARNAESMLACLQDALKTRAADASSLTLVHGDLNSSNILRPIEGDTPVYFVDRQPFDHSLTVWTGASDMAYIMALWWEIEKRRELEFPVLRRYYDALLVRGVRDYSWEDLIQDYKVGIAQAIYISAGWCAEMEDPEPMRWVWGRHSQRVMAAVDDLDILDVLSQRDPAGK
jgi:hypothetical protein